jgi:hypothetical protein
MSRMLVQTHQLLCTCDKRRSSTLKVNMGARGGEFGKMGVAIAYVIQGPSVVKANSRPISLQVPLSQFDTVRGDCNGGDTRLLVAKPQATMQQAELC